MNNIDCGEDIIFIDLSYFIFYRYYATLNWYKNYNKQDFKISDIMQNDDFVNKYSKRFETILSDIVKSYSVKWKNVFLVKDCAREDIWRNSLYSGYKATREDRMDTFNGDVFKFTYNELLHKLEKDFELNIIDHPNLEADDIIAIIKNSIRERNKDNKIVIITNDNDYIQLRDRNTYIINIQGKDICSRVNMSPDLYLKCKIIMGDKSDNIPSIMKHVGPKISEKLAQDEESFQKLCKNNPSALIQFELNKILIDFSCIPLEFKTSLLQKLIFVNI